MENDVLEKRVKDIYCFVENKTKSKTHYQANIEKLQKRSEKYYRNVSENEKI